jgi:hypothetical protein
MKAFLTVADFARRHPRAYLTGCFVFGAAVRFWWAHGDWVRFIDPRFPLFR